MRKLAVVMFHHLCAITALFSQQIRVRPIKVYNITGDTYCPLGSCDAVCCCHKTPELGKPPNSNRISKVLARFIKIGAQSNKSIYCKTQPSSIHWLSSTIFPCSSVRPSVRTSRIGDISTYLHYMMF